MSLLTHLKQLADDLSRTLFDPARPQRFADHLNALGLRAEAAYAPAPDLSDIPTDTRRVCIGRINLHLPPIRQLSLHVYRTGHRRRDPLIRFEHHYLADLPSSQPPSPLTANRTPHRRFWLCGPVTSHRWTGPLAQRLTSDQRLTHLLDSANLGPLTLETDRTAPLLWIVHPLTGRMTGVSSILSAAPAPTLLIENELPTPERLTALSELARSTLHLLPR